MKSILIIEDDRFLRELLAEKLIAAKFDVRAAEEGKSALAELEKRIPDLVLLDLLLPDMNGFEILSAIRKQEKWKKLPVIILSNLDQQSDLERARALGITDYMVKANFSLSEIVEKVRSVTGS